MSSSDGCVPEPPYTGLYQASSFIGTSLEFGGVTPGFGILAGFSSEFVNLHSFSNFKFWLRFSFISRFINFPFSFLRAGRLLMV